MKTTDARRRWACWTALALTLAASSACRGGGDEPTEVPKAPPPGKGLPRIVETPRAPEPLSDETSPAALEAVSTPRV